jgi:hypothetical protein
VGGRRANQADKWGCCDELAWMKLVAFELKSIDQRIYDKTGIEGTMRIIEGMWIMDDDKTISVYRLKFGHATINNRITLDARLYSLSWRAEET